MRAVHALRRVASIRIAILVVLAAAATASFAAAASAPHNGVLRFRGGVRAQTTINHSTCSAGPGNAIAISLVDVGGWSSLYLTASAPAHAKHGLAKVSLQGTGNKGNSYAIGVWSWSNQASSRTGAQVAVKGNGAAGAIDVKLPLVSVADSPSLPDVHVALKWTSGMCG